MGTTDPMPARVRELVAENDRLNTELDSAIGQIQELNARVDTVAPPKEDPSGTPA